MHRFATARVLVVLLAFGLIAAACGGSDSKVEAGGPESTAAPATTEATPADTEPPAPATTEEPAPATTEAAPATTEAAPELADLELLDAGAYTVGVTTVSVATADPERILTVDVWFPLADGATGDPHQYTFIPGTYYESPNAVTATVADASTDGPFPLVVYSHGSGGLRYIHSNYTEAIASHGYVVVAPDHIGNTALERITESSDPTEVIAFNRPTDISAVLDATLDPASPEIGDFTSMIDGESIAVTGHSFGGFTAYAMAIGHDAFEDQPEVAADERVDAIIPLAPAAGFFSDERMSTMSIPSMVIVGTDDKTTPVDPNVTVPWALIDTPTSYRVDLVAAEHQTFTDVCDYQAFLPTLEAPQQIVIDTIEANAQEGCLADDMPIERAQELTNTFAIRFLNEVFAGGDPIDPAITAFPDDVIFDAK